MDQGSGGRASQEKGTSWKPAQRGSTEAGKSNEGGRREWWKTRLERYAVVGM